MEGPDCGVPEESDRVSTPLAPGAVVILEGRYWLIAQIEEGDEAPLAVAKPARYRLTLRHPGGREISGTRPDRR